MDRALRTALNGTGPLVSALALIRSFPYLRAFPIRPDQKTPCLVGWQEKATNNGDELCELWNEARKVLGALTLGGGYPDVGIATGKPGGVFVVDCDSPDAAYWFESTFHLPGAHVLTSRGGHYYFECPELEEDIPRNSASRIFPKVDVRGKGGLVVAPPSSRKSGGKYEWTEHCEREFPYKPTELLLSLCKPPAKPVRILPETDYKANVGASLDRIVDNQLARYARSSEGERNDRLYRTAFLFGSMARGTPAERTALLSALRELLTIAVSLGLPKKEAHATGERAFDEGEARGSFLPSSKKEDLWQDLEKDL